MRVSWKEAFPQKTLQTGRHLFEKRFVQSVPSTQPLLGDIKTDVRDGNEYYVVQIDQEANLLKSWSCSCMRNDDGIPCAHIAAVLLALEGKGTSLEMEEPTTEDGKSWFDVLNGLSQNELRKLLLESIRLHPDLRERVILLKNRRITDSNYQEWKKHINYILKQYDPYDYWSLWKVVHQLEDFLHAELQDIQCIGTWEDQADFIALVFQICCDAILREGEDYYFSDESDLQNVLFRCNQEWISLAQNATPGQVARLKQWFLSHPEYMDYFMDTWFAICDDDYPED